MLSTPTAETDNHGQENMDGVQEDLLPDDMENVSGHGEETPVMEECAPSDSETEQESLLQQEPARSVILHKTAFHQIFFVMIITGNPSYHPSSPATTANVSVFCTVACYTVRNLSHAQSLDDTLSHGLPNYQLNKLQRVLNASARLVCNAPRFCHISPLLRALHWLPVKSRIEFKILLITFKAIHGLAPKYLCDLLTFKSSSYNLRSSDSILLSMPAVRSKTLGDRAFMVAAPRLWNSLPKDLRAITNVNSFKAHIKTYLFKTL